MVPGAGVEPALPKELDFESSASANSATRASKEGDKRGMHGEKRKPEFQEFQGKAREVAASAVGKSSGMGRVTLPVAAHSTPLRRET